MLWNSWLFLMRFSIAACWKYFSPGFIIPSVWVMFVDVDMETKHLTVECKSVAWRVYLVGTSGLWKSISWLSACSVQLGPERSALMADFYTVIGEKCSLLTKSVDFTSRFLVYIVFLFIDMARQKVVYKILNTRILPLAQYLLFWGET